MNTYYKLRVEKNMNTIRRSSITYFILINLFIPFNFIIAQNHVEVGIDEQLGAFLPDDAKFVTSENDTVQLKEIIDKPILLALVYYECPGICSPLLNELTWVIDKMDLEPGADYKIISLSFDYREKPKIAAKWKKNYLHSIKRKFDSNDWIFLTGDSLNIRKVTDAVGFYFKPSKDSQYIHPSTIIAISPQGKISRYIFGVTLNPFDVKMALIDAKSGKTNPTISKILEFCYSYDPEGRKYTLNITRIIGSLMLLSIGIFITILLLWNKRKKRS